MAPVWRKLRAAGIRNPANAVTSRDSGVPRRRLEDYEQRRKQIEFSDVTGDGGKAGALVPAGWLPQQKRISGTCRELLRGPSGGGNKHDAPAGGSVGHRRKIAAFGAAALIAAVQAGRGAGHGAESSGGVRESGRIGAAEAAGKERQ